MTDINDSSKPGNFEASSDSKPADQAALALKSSVLADAQDLTDGAKQLAGGAVAQARESAQAQITGGKDRLAEGLGSVAEAIRQTGEKLSEGDQAGLTSYVSRAADGVEAASDYLKEKSIGDVLGDVGSFARREPAMFLGGAFVLGLLGGRFLKSSQGQSSPPIGGGADSQASPGRAKSTGGRPNGQRESRGKPARSPSALSGSKPIQGERTREIGSVDDAPRSYGDGPNLPGTV